MGTFGNNSEPLIRGAVSLPLPNVKHQKMIFAGADDDITVCLNCKLPSSKCRGTERCYLKHKKKKDGSESNGRS